MILQIAPVMQEPPKPGFIRTHPRFTLTMVIAILVLALILAMQVRIEQNKAALKSAEKILKADGF